MSTINIEIDDEYIDNFLFENDYAMTDENRKMCVKELRDQLQNAILFMADEIEERLQEAAEEGELGYQLEKEPPEKVFHVPRGNITVEIWRTRVGKPYKIRTIDYRSGEVTEMEVTPEELIKRLSYIGPLHMMHEIDARMGKDDDYYKSQGL